MITLSDIQKRLAECIKHCGLTQTELGRRLGIKQQTISHYVKGDIMPALDTLANLCKILDVSPAYILCFEEGIGERTYIHNDIKNSYNNINNSGNITF